jgi:hypothetical protein
MMSVHERAPQPLFPNASAPGSSVATCRGEGPPSFAHLMRGLARSVDVGEETVRGVSAAGGAVGADPGHLLALQAGIYRYSATVDLAAQLVDKATGAVKAVVQAGG